MPEAGRTSAGGPLAGYLFQLERALLRLVELPRGGVVWLEADDDLVIELNDGSVVLEQLKHSIRPGYSFTDRSRAFWHCLRTWVRSAIDAPALAARTSYVLVANRAVAENSLARGMGEARESSEAEEWVAELRRVGQSGVSTAAEQDAREVLAAPDSLLAQICVQTDLVTPSEGEPDEAYRLSIMERLQVPSSEAVEAVYLGLRGWLEEVALKDFRHGTAARISWEAFVEQMQRLRRQSSQRRLLSIAEQSIALSKDAVRDHADRVFVRQMVLLGLGDDAPYGALHAIKDYLAAAKERDRLSREGLVTQQDVIDFQDHIEDRWRLIFTQEGEGLPATIDELVERRAGRIILAQTMQIPGTLAGIRVDHEYLTRGHCHELSDLKVIGWHPRYKSLLENA